MLFSRGSSIDLSLSNCLVCSRLRALFRWRVAESAYSLITSSASMSSSWICKVVFLVGEEGKWLDYLAL